MIKRNVKTATVLGVAALAGAVIAPAASGSASKHKPVVKKVQVVDDAFMPTKLTLKKGNEVNFVWSNQNYDTHNVTLMKGPRGVRHSKFTSYDGVRGLHFQRTLTATGTYHFECTIHPGMNITVVVKK